MHSRVLLAVVLGFSLLFTACAKSEKRGKLVAEPSVVAVIETDKGAIHINLLPTVAPKTVENFRLLSERGFYDGLTFHRIVKDFMIQGGDPLGTGFGGESAWGGTFADEIDRKSPLYRTGYKRGSVAMANTGPNTNACQFFIVQRDYPLPADYTIFGQVSRGMEVVDALMDTPTERGVDGRMTKPKTPLVIRKIRVESAPTPPPR
ncbi:peptidylprolyl isomerase [Opitutus sp. ER46]|uniref:peptidylprolyl isomerase n=1 Tax=Opitutus sp. ER46 TaxID=2161864 RepID=UPI000D30BCDF|nr:peptidylprolyl isomerase [Opitutus sp. ER46]PTX91022.1 peptidylprolyl isomerase [Opitutus sp. ER46]